MPLQSHQRPAGSCPAGRLSRFHRLAPPSQGSGRGGPLNPETLPIKALRIPPRPCCLPLQARPPISSAYPTIASGTPPPPGAPALASRRPNVASPPPRRAAPGSLLGPLEILLQHRVFQLYSIEAGCLRVGRVPWGDAEDVYHVQLGKPVLSTSSAALRAARSASLEPSVGQRTLVGKVLM